MAFTPSILRVMAITDGLHVNGDIISRVMAAARGGATSIQIRLKGIPARVVAEITKTLVDRLDIPILVNDRFDIALAAGAAGVHVGADDIPVADVRTMTPPGFIIGTSVGCDAEIPNATFADFVGIGPVFATPSKPDAGTPIGTTELARLAAATGKPTIAIGGITTTNASTIFTPDAIQSGVMGIAVVSAIFSTTGLDSIESSTRTLRTLVDESTSHRSRL